MDDKTDYPLYKLVKAWRNKIKLSKQDKKVKFQDEADECKKFFKGGRELSDLLWKGRTKDGGGMVDSEIDAEEKIPAPKFRVVLNKAAELVQIFGPFIYHKNPTIVVEPKYPEIPPEILIGLIPPEQLQAMQQQHDMQAQMAAQQAEMMGQPAPEIPPFDPMSLFPPETQADSQAKLIAFLLQYYLDYIQRENDKKTEARLMVDEALVKGCSVLWTESFESYPGAPSQVGSFWDTVDNLIGDPDADRMQDWTWCARRKQLPYWEWEEKFNLPAGSLKDKANKKSHNGEAEMSTKESFADDENRGQTNDLLECWEIFSKTGMGHKLAGVKDEELSGMLDEMGRYCYLVVSEKCNYFLNIPSDVLEERMTAPEKLGENEPDPMFDAVQWPIPFWADGQWPFTSIAFHEQTNCAWPVSHLSAGMGQLKALNWVITFMVNRLRVAMRTMVSTQKGVGEEVINRLFSGEDFTVLPIENALDPSGDVSKIVHFMQSPEMKADAWRVVELLSDSFDKATGLTETAYAMQGGMRTAAEANVKQNAMNIRPDDMANKMEDTMSLVARKEAMAARWLLSGESIAPAMGQRCAQMWEQYVMTSDVDAVVREFHYRVEAGSARKPNKETQIANMNNAMQTMLPVLMQSGSLQAADALIQDWCKAMDIEGEKYHLQPPPPPGPDPVAQQEAELEMQKTQADMQRDDQKHQAKMAETSAKMQMAQQKHELEAQGKVLDLQMREREGQQKLQQQALQGQMQMRAQQMKTNADMQATAAKLQVDRLQATDKIQAQRAETAMKLESGAAQNALKIQAMKQQAKAKPKPKSGDKK